MKIKLVLTSVLCTFVSCTLLCLAAASAQAPGHELPRPALPLMGWSSWNHFDKRVTDTDVRATADALVSSGLRDLGYVYVNIDGSWEGERDENGVLHSNPRKFPDMKALGDYIHARGLKYGVYSSPGPLTCGGFKASYTHEDQDAQMFASWGADYLKYDLCSWRVYMNVAASKADHAAAVKEEIAGYERMHQALLKTGRPIVYALCQYGLDYVWEWGPSVGATMWRTTGDVKDTFDSVSRIGFAQAGLAKYAGPGSYIDPDSLEIGNGGQTPDEYRLNMSLWSMLAAPLILGNDVSRMDRMTLSIVGNKEVIAVDQDPLVKAGDRVWAVGQLELWARPLKDNAMAVALFNRNQGVTTMSFKLKDVGWQGPARARDLWAHKDIGTITDTFTADVPEHGVVMLTLHR